MEAPFHITIIEDSPENALIFRMTAERALPSLVEVHEDGLRGLEACLRTRPDLVITDLDLPSLRGEEICRLLRSSPVHRDMPLIVCVLPSGTISKFGGGASWARIAASIWLRFSGGAFSNCFMNMAR